MASDDLDPDPRELRPAPLRDDRAVVPRDTPIQLVRVGALRGAGVSLSVAGLVLGVRSLWLAFPFAVGVATLPRMLVPWSDDRVLERLRRRREEDAG